MKLLLLEHTEGFGGGPTDKYVWVGIGMTVTDAWVELTFEHSVLRITAVMVAVMLNDDGGQLAPVRVQFAYWVGGTKPAGKRASRIGRGRQCRTC